MYSPLREVASMHFRENVDRYGMSTQTVRYQSELLTELIRSAEAQANLSSAEAEKLCQRIADANSEHDIGELWADVDQTYRLLDEDKWN